MGNEQWTIGTRRLVIAHCPFGSWAACRAIARRPKAGSCSADPSNPGRAMSLRPHAAKASELPYLNASAAGAEDHGLAAPVDRPFQVAGGWFAIAVHGQLAGHAAPKRRG